MWAYGLVWTTGLAPERFLCRPSDVQDGLSQTILIAEQAGWPSLYTRFGILPNTGLSNADWTEHGGRIMRGANYDGIQYGPCAINCENGQGFYSFHPQGANVLFCDGSVTFITQDVPVRIIARLITRNGGEVVNPGDY
jgi:prepilin-type processing-associated H-X9-DG protein